MPINQSIINKFKSNRLGIVADALVNLSMKDEFESLSFDGSMHFIIDFIEDHKRMKKAEKLRLNANLPFCCSVISEFDFNTQPNISKLEVELLVKSDWRKLTQHQILAGSLGDNKLELGSAIANAVIDVGNSAQAFTIKKLLLDLRVSFSRDQFKDKLAELNKLHLLLISDWQLCSLPLEDIPLLSLLIDSRKYPFLIMTNLTQSDWLIDIELSKLPASIQHLITKHCRVWDVNEPSGQKLH